MLYSKAITDRKYLAESMDISHKFNNVRNMRPKITLNSVLKDLL